MPLGPGGRAWHADGVVADALVCGTHVYAREGDDLLVLDPATGDARHRLGGVLAETSLLLPLPVGFVAALADDDEAPLVVLVDGRRGRVVGRWTLPADGVALTGDPLRPDGLWLWTEDGSLVRVPLP